jgi:ABC-type dipeptide/oligopeptide/nickel transport system permease subunit
MASPAESSAAGVGIPGQTPDGSPQRDIGTVRRAARALRSDKAGLFGVLVVTLIIMSAVLAPIIAPYDPMQGSLRARLLPPFWLANGSMAHPLGTDALGRDVLSRTLYGSQTSLLIGATVVLITGVFGSVLGLLAGYRGGRTDAFIMRWVDIQVAFPALLLALVILAVVRPSAATLIVVLALNGWMVYARMVRSIVMSVRHTTYVEAAQIIGCRPLRVIFRHILPNLTSPLLTLAVIEFARIVLSEAALSFLGLGIQPPAASWGLDVATGRNYLFSAWWLVAIPGAAITITVLATNMLAGWLRIAVDPREQEKRYARLAESAGIAS